MMIHIFGEYYVDADDNCYMVGRKVNRMVKQTDGTKAEKEGLKDVKYFSTIAQAIQSVYERSLRNIVKDSDGDIFSLCTDFTRLYRAFTSEIDRAFPDVTVSGRTNDA